MTAEMKQLKSVKGSCETDPNSILTNVEAFLTKHDLLIIDDTIEDDVELEKPRLQDERLLVKLNLFERKCFVYAMLLDAFLKDAVVSIEADANEKITAIMRERKVLLQEAMQIYMAQRNVDDPHTDLNMAASTYTFLVSMYEWHVRARTNSYQGRLIVREGFTAYLHG